MVVIGLSGILVVIALAVPLRIFLARLSPLAVRACVCLFVGLLLLDLFDALLDLQHVVLNGRVLILRTVLSVASVRLRAHGGVPRRGQDGVGVHVRGGV